MDFSSSTFLADFEAFGEVLAENLTRCHTESFHDYNLVIFSVAFGEILDQNLTKCHKNLADPAKPPGDIF